MAIASPEAAAAADEQNFCARCSAPASQRCGACEERNYCSRECQRADWRAHKPNCKRSSVPAPTATPSPASDPQAPAARAASDSQPPAAAAASTSSSSSDIVRPQPPTQSAEPAPKCELTKAEIEQRARELLSLFKVVHLNEPAQAPVQVLPASPTGDGGRPASGPPIRAELKPARGSGPAGGAGAGVQGTKRTREEFQARARADPAEPKPAEEAPLQAVRIAAGGRCGEPKNVRLGRGGPIFQRGEPSPVLHLLGVPVRVAREADHSHLPRTGRLDNQMATFFMIEPVSGFAPPKWESNVGDAFVFRTDGKPFTVDHAWCLWDYFNSLLDVYGYDDSERRVRVWLRRGTFDEFVADYNKRLGLSLEF
eukprot:tig00021037_g17457.t1